VFNIGQFGHKEFDRFLNLPVFIRPIWFWPNVWGAVWHRPVFFGQSASGEDLSFFFFEVVFCGTAATIVSGAVAERMRFLGYILTTVAITGTIYPIIGHWVWVMNGGGGMVGWLGQMGFKDFAGSSVVHSVGGWRSGRYQCLGGKLAAGEKG
jgi:Amt family ammonium transporter